MKKYNLPVGFDGKTTEFHPDVYDQAQLLQWLETEDGLIFAAIVHRETKETVAFEKEEFQQNVLNGFALDLDEFKPATWALVEDQGDEECTCGECESVDVEFYSNDDSGKLLN